MKISEMTVKDIKSVIPLYIEHYNQHEGGCWTEEKVEKRISQVVTTQDSFSLIMKDDKETIGFVMGYFKQYDDLVSYYLDEIVIANSHQHKGYGSILLGELEKRVQEKGGAGIELSAVKDEMHERFYSKAGYQNAGNFTMKCKWFISFD